MPLFKKGDLVRARSTTVGYTKGRLYVVRKDQSRGDYVMTDLDDSGSTSNGWAAENFELVTSLGSNAFLQSQLANNVPPPQAKVLGTQVGGAHYTDCAIQPIEYIWANNLGFSEGNVIKYVTRWKTKGGVKDLEKARHHLALLIEREESQKAE